MVGLDSEEVLSDLSYLPLTVDPLEGLKVIVTWFYTAGEHRSYQSYCDFSYGHILVLLCVNY